MKHNKKCLNCASMFPSWVLIDGKRRCLKNRKYCLNCSPFGKRNRKQLEKEKEKLLGVKCICSICSKEYLYKRKSGHLLKICNACKTNKNRHNRKKRAIKYKGGKCVKCGYNNCIDALDFHHKNPSEKDFRISGKHCLSWEKIKKELNKCILVCANCHREIHSKTLTK